MAGNLPPWLKGSAGDPVPPAVAAKFAGTSTSHSHKHKKHHPPAKGKPNGLELYKARLAAAAAKKKGS